MLQKKECYTPHAGGVVKLALKTDCTQTFCPHFSPLWWRSTLEVTLGEIRQLMNKEIQIKLFIFSTFCFPPHISVKLKKSEYRTRDDAQLWIPVLSLYNHLQFSSRKGNETEDDRKAFPAVKPCCHRGLFTVSVTMATA